MKSQACEPCAKRKVRCDKEEPCSNCKRRKHDNCSYPEPTPADKIKSLEALVRNLGGDPTAISPVIQKRAETTASPIPSVKPPAPHSDIKGHPSSSKDPVIAEEDGQTFYLESRQWSGWLGHDHGDETGHKSAKNPFFTGNHPHAFEGVLFSKPSLDVAARYPPLEYCQFLWRIQYERIFPLLRISFSWELQRLESESKDFEKRSLLSNAQHSYIFALFLLSIVSLSEKECEENLHQPRATLLLEYQMLCEENLSHTNIFCMTDITVLKALAVYMMAGHDRLSTQSLWSVMGLVIRNAEKLGIHRDGSLLELSPLATEERRRLWWQLQHFDLALAIKCGLTPQTLKADWDVKLPLNVEDEDIGPNMLDPPQERKGLTSMSYCLFTYWVIDKQRQFFRTEKNRFEISWQLDQSIQQTTKDTLVDQLESGLNHEFLQYCDPLKPVDMLLQLVARMLVCGFRQRTLQPTSNDEDREEFLRLSIQMLEYNIAIYSQSSITKFRWLTKAFLPWSAFMYVVVEATKHEEGYRAQKIWDLLSELYASNEFLSELAEDRRRVHAAELVTAAWKARQNKVAPNQSPVRPEFVTHLEARLADHRSQQARRVDANDAVQGNNEGQNNAVDLDGSFSDTHFPGNDFSLDFSDFDWSFWSSID